MYLKLLSLECLGMELSSLSLINLVQKFIVRSFWDNAATLIRVTAAIQVFECLSFTVGGAPSLLLLPGNSQTGWIADRSQKEEGPVIAGLVRSSIVNETIIEIS